MTAAIHLADKSLYNSEVFWCLCRTYFVRGAKLLHDYRSRVHFHGELGVASRGFENRKFARHLYSEPDRTILHKLTITVIH